MTYRISRRDFVNRLGIGSVSAAAAMAGAAVPKHAHAQMASKPVDNATLVTVGRPAGASHTLVTNNDGRVTIHVIDGPEGLIVVDSGDAPEYAAEARSLAESIGKPIAAVFISHDHPDHTGGLVSYSGLPIFTSSGILENIRNGPFPKPDNLAEVETLDDAQTTIAGLDIRIHNY